MTSRATPSANKPRRRPRTTKVPVASRERARREPDKTKAKPNFFQQDITSVVILIAVVLAVLLAIAVPLRNFYEGRSEIARLNDSIAALEQRKTDLQGDIARYEDPEYIKQEARRRLGVMEPGESAWRIIDPRMTHGENITTDEVPDERVWHEVLWDSLREAPEMPEVPAVEQ